MRPTEGFLTLRRSLLGDRVRVSFLEWKLVCERRERGNITELEDTRHLEALVTAIARNMGHNGHAHRQYVQVLLKQNARMDWPGSCTPHFVLSINRHTEWTTETEGSNTSNKPWLFQEYLKGASCLKAPQESHALHNFYHKKIITSSIGALLSKLDFCKG